jgi:hypothetical protein
LPDLKKYAAQTERRLVIGLLSLCFTVGLGLIWLFYGVNAALLGLLCLLGGVVLIVAILLMLNLIERISKHG